MPCGCERRLPAACAAHGRPSPASPHTCAHVPALRNHRRMHACISTCTCMHIVAFATKEAEAGTSVTRDVCEYGRDNARFTGRESCVDTMADSEDTNFAYYTSSGPRTVSKLTTSVGRSRVQSCVQS